MNPFSPDRSYDDHLSDIVTRLGKTPVSPGALQDLLDYLPEIDLKTDISVIKMRLRPLFQSKNPQTRLLTNRIMLEILQRTKTKYLQSVQCEWTYHNFDAPDRYSKVILSKYFDVRQVEAEFFSRISWEDPVHDLPCFLFLIRKSGSEFWFDVNRLDFNTNHVFDRICEILQVISSRKNAGEEPAGSDGLSTGMGKLAVADSAKSPFFTLSEDIFDRIRLVTDPLFIDKKYKILFTFYGYADDSIYEESEYFSDQTFEHFAEGRCQGRPSFGTEKNLLCDDRIDYDRLHASSLSQIRLVINRVRDKEEFLLRHLRPSMNIFAVCKEFRIRDSFVLSHREQLMPVINASIDGIYRKQRVDPAHCGSTFGEDELMLALLDFVAEKHRIILAWILKRPLNPVEFSKETIEEVFECSVAVFPKEFFFADSFGCSCLPLLKAYDCDVEKALSLYKNTRFEDAVFYIEDVNTLKRLILSGSVQEALQRFGTIQDRRSGKNTERFNTIWHIFYYKLRNRIDMPKIDFGFVFEHFLSKEYILFLGRQPGNREGLLRESVEYIGNVAINNTVYLTGYNFDDQKDFYYNLGTPAEDPAVRLLHDVYCDLGRRTEEDILLHLLQLILYKDIEILEADKIAEHIAGAPPFDLKKNTFVMERFLRQLYNRRCQVDVEMLSINRNKAADVLLRYFDIDYRRLGDVNATHLSLAGLSSLLETLQTRRENGGGKDERLEAYLDATFPKREFAVSSSTYIKFLESDKNMLDGSLRGARLLIYDRIIDQIATEASNSLINSYSFSKLESKSDNQAVFELMMGAFDKTEHSFWLLVVRALHLTNNLYISLFIEDMVVKSLTDGKSKDEKGCGGNTVFDGVICISEYVRMCTKEELSMLAFVFPLLYRCLDVKREIFVEDLIKATAEKKIENSRVRFSKSADSCILRMTYVFDSVSYAATISVPANFPFGSPRLDFDYKATKCPKFFLKINELLRRSTKFAEIFMQWKVNLDNRFDGHKECLICYYILEPKMRTFADYACENCHNRFHKRCIFEWIRTSKNMQCPLCRVEMDVWE